MSFWFPSLSHQLSLERAEPPHNLRFHFVTVASGRGEREDGDGEKRQSMRTRSRRTGQSSSRSGAAREPPPPQQLLPDDIEKENAAILDKLPREVWEKITRWSGCFEFAMTCRYFRDLLQEHADAERKRRLEDAKTTTWYGRPERLSRKYGEYLETTLQSYTYIDTHDFGDCIYSATMVSILSCLGSFSDCFH